MITKKMNDNNQLLLSIALWIIKKIIRKHGTATNGFVLYGIRNIIEFYVMHDSPYSHYALTRNKDVLYHVWNGGNKNFIFPSISEVEKLEK